MLYHSSFSRKVFVLFNTVFFIVYSVLCLLPFINTLAISLSSKNAAIAGQVGLWPVDFTLKSYSYLMEKTEFWTSIIVSFKRLFLGAGINMFLTVITAYPLSRSVKDFRMRTPAVWFFVFTMLFGGGLIPGYIVVKSVGLIDSIWALVIPGAVPIFNIILLLNFIRMLPREMEESAFMDGAGYWTILWNIVVPASVPCLVTLLVFTFVGHWNSWFDGLIYMNKPVHYPLQTYLQSIIVNPQVNVLNKAQAKLLAYISDRTVKAAQILIGSIPILLIYPIAQRYYVMGIVLGSVKE